MKYWNRAGEPKLTDLTFVPQPRLNPLVLDRAVQFSPGGEWRREQFLATRARLEGLGLYSGVFFDLNARPGNNFDLTIHAPEKKGWGNTKLMGPLSFFRDLPYLTTHPQFLPVL